ncbi:MarR family transcriptional regulator [Desulfocarbo indianensis]|nr:MarR family transcriptional regulator [Desulfocarbo indianensis]
METKDDLIKETIHVLLRVAKMYARIEEMPILLSDDRAVTTREAHTIQAVGENEPMTVTGLAGYFGISKSAASQMVSKLAKKGFLLKKQSVQSAKENELSLTAVGWLAFRAHEQFHGRDMADLVERLSGFSLSQIATISVMLEAVGSLMDRRLANPPGSKFFWDFS